MKLDDYIKQTLLDITKGVAAAQKETSLWIAPGYFNGEKVSVPQLVSFDIAVVVNKEGSGGIQVWSFGEAKAKGSFEQSNRISFSVPIYFQGSVDQSKK